MKTHSGSWKNTDIIKLNSMNQYILDEPPVLGLDTEMLVLKGFTDKIAWPWALGLPQEREPEAICTGGRLGQGFDFHGDGYATELCVAPRTCLEGILIQISLAISWLKANKISVPAFFNLPATAIKQAPDGAKKLGCMPSINIYGDSGNPSSLPDNQRTTGCHLHISHSSLKDIDTSIALVKWADILVGCVWTLISPNPKSEEVERRKAYGRAGEYRLKEYPEKDGNIPQGVEYRVLPGTPMQHPAYLTLMFNLYRSALKLAVKYGDPQEELSVQAKNTINNADKAEARRVVDLLPFSFVSKNLIKYLSKNRLKVNNNQWARLGFMGRGHQHLMRQKKVTN